MIKISESVIELKSLLRYTTISLNNVFQGDKRLEASFYDVEAKKVREIISKCKLVKKPLFDKKTGFIKNAFYTNRFKRIFVKNGKPIYTPSEIVLFKPTTPKFISEKTNVDFDLIRLKKNMIVLTRSGTVGSCSIVTRTLQDKLFSDDLIRLVVNDESDTGYVYAFLKTHLGKKLITTQHYGSVINHLEPEHLATIQVPVPTDSVKKKIHDAIMKSFRLRDEANELFEESKKQFMKLLKLNPLSQLKPKYFEKSDVRNFSTSLKNLDQRFDASYHIPIVDSIVNQLKKSKFELTTIGDSRISKEIILPGRFKRYYVDSDYGIPFLGSREILEYDPQELKYLSLKNHGKRIQKELTLKQNMILVTCSGTIGNVILTPKYYNSWTGSQHIIRIIPDDSINVGYVYAFLASEYGSELIKRYSHGSVVDELTDDQVANIPILLPSNTIMNKIGNLVLDANKLRNIAYNSEHDAIKLTEETIIKN